LYEVWGFTPDSGTWLYDTMVVGLPQGLPVGTRVNERVRFVGYFFKLQGYHEANAKPHAPAISAPMLIGRLVWIQAPPPPPPAWDVSWGLLVVGGFVLIVVFQLAWMFLKPKRRRSSMKPIGEPKPGAIAIDEWFQQAEEGTAPIAEDSPSAPPSPDRTAEGGGSGKGAGELSSHPLDEDLDGGG
jgi:hypothetical protein